MILAPFYPGADNSDSACTNMFSPRRPKCPRFHKSVLPLIYSATQLGFASLRRGSIPLSSEIGWGMLTWIPPIATLGLTLIPFEKPWNRRIRNLEPASHPDGNARRACWPGSNPFSKRNQLDGRPLSPGGMRFAPGFSIIVSKLCLPSRR